MTKFITLLINCRLRYIAYLVWFVLIPVIVVSGMFWGVFMMLNTWYENLIWIRDKEV